MTGIFTAYTHKLDKNKVLLLEGCNLTLLYFFNSEQNEPKEKANTSMPRLLPKTETHNEPHLLVSWLSAKSLLLGPDCVLPYRACRQEQEKVLKFKVTIYKYTTRTPTELQMLKSELDLPLWPAQWTPQAMWKSLTELLFHPHILIFRAGGRQMIRNKEIYTSAFNSTEEKMEGDR